MSESNDALEARTVELCLMYEASNLSVDVESVEALAARVVAKATHIVGAQLATFFVLNSREDSWTAAATVGCAGRTVRSPEFDRSSEIMRLLAPELLGEISVLSERKSLNILFPDCSVNEAVIAPLFSGGEQHGLLSVGRADGRLFSASQLRLYRILAMRTSPLLERALLNRALRDEATTDSLTGLWNRRQLQDDLADPAPLFGEAHSVALLMFDLTSFKWINDTFGHARGDVVLRDFGSALAAHAPSKARIYRLAGDEFVVLAPDYNDTEHERYMKSLREALRGMGRSSDNGPLVDFDVGIAHYPSDASDTVELLRVADKRMYRMKHSRR